MLDTFTSDTSELMAYYYFDFGEVDNRIIDSCIRSLIVQLIVKLPEVPHNLATAYARSRDNKQEPSTEVLKDVLRGIILAITKVVVVIDALDECSAPEELVQFIEDLRSWNDTAIQLLVVSRRHFDGTDALEELRPVHVSIQDESANNDILKFVQEILGRDPKLKRWPPKVKREIEKALIFQSSGM